MKILATGLGVGYLPICPGTFGSFAAIGVYALIIKWNIPLQVGIILAIFLLGVWVAHQAEILWGRKDPGPVVIDEIVGYLITMGFIPFSTVKAVLGFFLFRAFDILKPFPIRRLEGIPGGWGIMTDDVLAGLYAAIVLRALLWFCF
ncbi:MAG: phosphatidylglycerophosphatase A [bacterium]